ncbi:MAG: hypothetical protein ACXADA_07865 [Candidatus Hodarchaeales archaeon]
MSIFIRYRKFWNFYTKLFIVYLSSMASGYLLDSLVTGSFRTYNFIIGLGWLGLGFFLIISLFGRRPQMIEIVHLRRETIDHYTRDYWKSRGGVIIVGATFAVFGLLMVLLSASSEKEPVVFFLALIGIMITTVFYLFLRNIYKEYNKKIR